VLSTLRDIQRHIARTAPELLRKIYVLEDATSPVPAPPLTPLPASLDFPNVARGAFEELRAAGMNIVTTAEPMGF
jgi:hypothetical protein